MPNQIASTTPRQPRVFTDVDLFLSQDEPQTSGLVKDFREMRAEMYKMGLFKSNKMYYAWKCLSQLFILVRVPPPPTCDLAPGGEANTLSTKFT